jgi:hypothetical protein
LKKLIAFLGIAAGLVMPFIFLPWGGDGPCRPNPAYRLVIQYTWVQAVLGVGLPTILVGLGIDILDHAWKKKARE